MYAVSICAVHENKPDVTYNDVFLLYANNREEAQGKATLIANKLFPALAGWRVSGAFAGDGVASDIDALQPAKVPT